MKFPCDLSQERLPVKSTLSKMTSQPLPVPVKLMLEVSGLDAGKFRIVQFPSILICEGGTGLTKPSITPPKLATQPPRDGAQQQQHEGEQQDFDPAVTHPHMLSAARCHLRPRPTHQAISSGPRQSARWTGFRRSRRRRAPAH